MRFNKDVQRFMMQMISETFAEVRKFVADVDYSPSKIEKGLKEIGAMFDLDVVVPHSIQKPIQRIELPVNLKRSKILCSWCGNPVTRKIRQPSGLHFECERHIAMLERTTKPIKLPATGTHGNK